MVECQPSKLAMRVRFPSPAPPSPWVAAPMCYRKHNLAAPATLCFTCSSGTRYFHGPREDSVGSHTGVSIGLPSGNERPVDGTRRFALVS